MLAALGSVAGSLWFPIQTKHLIDQFNGGGIDLRQVALVAAVLTGGAAAGALSAYMLARVGYQVVAALRVALVEKLLRLPVASFDSESSGERVSRVVRDCEAISELITKQTINLVTGVLLLGGSVVVLLLLDVPLTLTLLGSVVAAFVVMIPIAFLLDGLSRRTQDRVARMSGILTHIFQEIRLVKAFTAEAHERRRSVEEIEDLKRLGLKTARISVVLEPLMGLAMTLAIIIILVYGAARVAAGEISIGTLTAFILYIFNVVNPLGQLTNFTAELQKAKGASVRIAGIFAEAEEASTPQPASRKPGGVLEFRNVSFAYGGRDRIVLNGIDLRFEPGTTTALVGASGSGKTTVLSLIERFYEPSEGEILYHGRPIGDYPLPEWRGGIGYVAQSAPVMPGTVRENIVYGLSGTFSDADVRSAAERAGALDFIDHMPQGLDTVLIEQGNNLSGGQRQRIAIARMFLRDPDILILDEATSNLDSETEHQVKLALEKLMQDRTNIIVAHRLSTVMHADRICFLDNGRISGTGNHAELIASHPYYARLVQRQFQQPLEVESLEAG
ncbi:ABC transporter ATP-binding protein/permease [Lysobacter capsici]|uniref:ABC transporter ATP-binding protein n=1 Tax=Lysobacter capsici TaxID=435897 RepID=UPI0011E0672B|nr:ABC transporter ATP-binding protein [Lysobacter capsici]UOF17390.1 ABC transporter ATP-binding protein/permease [Lysobacter capsici]WND83119.1 ABC transporter ATP-binding protein [Lysobacter capsici]WND88318.1 ABC transporter ATP-binding protein [Lysobacter capsici]